MQTRFNLQDTFLTRARRNRLGVTLFLMNGYQLRGTITGFDPFTVTVSAEGKQSLIYKHAISTISPARPVDLTAWENGE